MGPIQTIDEFVSMLRRRFWLIAVIALPIALMAAAYARMQPQAFETAAVIQIETPTVVETPGGPNTGEASTLGPQRVQMIEQRLMVRENLAGLVRRYGLFADQTALSENDKVALLREAVRLQSVTASQQAYGSGPVTALIISARLPEAEQAQSVANDLARAVLVQSADAASERARQTLAFFQDEEARVGKEVATLESEITAFKNANLAALPDALNDARAELADLQSDIRTMEQDKLTMRQERAALIGQVSLAGVYRRRIDEIDAQLSVMEEQEQALFSRQAELEATIARAPAVEGELNAFTRRLQQLQDRYDVVTRRLAEAETAQRLQSNEQSGRLKMLEPAVLPENPVGSSSNKLTTVGAVGGLILGFLAAFLLEMLNPVLRSSSRMQRQLGLVPVIAIPRLRPGTR